MLNLFLLLKQLLELREKIGSVSRGYDEKTIKKLPEIDFITLANEKKGRGEIEKYEKWKKNF